MISLGGLSGGSGWSTGGSTASGITDAQNWSQGTATGFGYSHSAEQSISEQGGYSNGSSYNQVFGREASAQEVANAAKANDIQMQMWAKQAAYNAIEAEKNRKYQEYMSNTAYQRAVQDLKKAGLNPILAAGAAATTPTGATASAGLSSASKANAHAESIGYSKNESKNWGYSKSSASSHSYNESKSKNSSYGYSRGSNSASSWENSEYTNNIKEVAQGAMGTVNNIVNSTLGGLTEWREAKKDRDYQNSIIGKSNNYFKTAVSKAKKGVKKEGYHR